MHEDAEAALCTLSHFILVATGFPKVGHGGKLGLDGLPHLSSSYSSQSQLSLHLLHGKTPFQEVISKIITDIHLHLSVFLHLCENLLKKLITIAQRKPSADW